jgi:hypothetical protein
VWNLRSLCDVRLGFEDSRTVGQREPSPVRLKARPRTVRRAGPGSDENAGGRLLGLDHRVDQPWVAATQPEHPPICLLHIGVRVSEPPPLLRHLRPYRVIVAGVLLFDCFQAALTAVVDARRRSSEAPRPGPWPHRGGSPVDAALVPLLSRLFGGPTRMPNVWPIAHPSGQVPSRHTIMGLAVCLDVQIKGSGSRNGSHSGSQTHRAVLHIGAQTRVSGPPLSVVARRNGPVRAAGRDGSDGSARMDRFLRPFRTGAHKTLDVAFDRAALSRWPRAFLRRRCHRWGRLQPHAVTVGQVGRWPS